MIHFHIRWSDSKSHSKLDWEAFQTREEAITQAKELVLPGEMYVIEQFDDACPRCNDHAVELRLSRTFYETSVNDRS